MRRVKGEDVSMAVRSPAVCVAGPITPNKDHHGRRLLSVKACALAVLFRGTPLKGQRDGTMVHGPYESESEKQMRDVPTGGV